MTKLTLASTLCAVLLAACGGGDRSAPGSAPADSGMPEAMMPDSASAPEQDSTAQPVGEDTGSATGMVVDLAAVGGSEATGTAAILGDAGGSPEATIEVTVRNGPGSDELPAHLHRGRCGSDQGVAAPLAQVNTAEGGGGTSSTTLPVSVLRSGDLFIQVHDRSGAPLLCGDIAAGS